MSSTTKPFAGAGDLGQERPVTVDIVLSEGEVGVMANLRRKAREADRMFAALVAEMNHTLNLEPPTDPGSPVETPSWLTTWK